MVEIYGTERCAFCKMAVSFCESRGIEYTYVTLDKQTTEILNSRLGTPVRAVPQIFINGNHAGGYMELVSHMTDSGSIH